MVSKHTAAEAAAALETKLRTAAEQHKADVKALQSQISQLKVKFALPEHSYGSHIAPRGSTGEGSQPEVEGVMPEQMERSTVSAAHEALRGEHEALQGEAAITAKREKSRSGEEAGTVAQLQARMAELRV